MSILLRSATIINPQSKHHGQQRDLLIERGRITGIGKKLKNPAKVKELKSDNLHVSPGWVDMFAWLADPGYEHKEDILSGIKAAAAGGFTQVCALPNTLPAVDSKSQVEYVLNRSRGQAVNVWPIGAISQRCEGEDITEIYDMHQAGAIAFSDGLLSATNAGLTLRALQYVKVFNGLVITHPDERSIRGNGVMNEGPQSVNLGMKGIPAIGEELVVKRDLQLLQYAESRLHIAYISTKEAAAAIKEAKKKGQTVSCSVSPYNLAVSDEVLHDYDANYKVLPPLRSKEDNNALLKALKDGTIDTIASMHVPHDIEAKQVEFDLAEFGMLGLQTAYPLVNTAVGKKLDAALLVEKLSLNARKLLGLPVPALEEGEKADLTIFDPDEEWTLEEKDILSKSKNTPFIGKQFRGKVLGIIHNGQEQLNS